ncbi:MAG: hypothetical protein K6T61_17330, partial [Bryobacteraceae bacterium]|nr:hypothetical protein [Bryobacteraceae bacterium]
PNAPPGVKGISLFLASKVLVEEDGKLGAANDLRVGGLEHKLGIHGSPTCVMLFEGAKAAPVTSPAEPLPKPVVRPAPAPAAPVMQAAAAPPPAPSHFVIEVINGPRKEEAKFQRPEDIRP